MSDSLAAIFHLVHLKCTVYYKHSFCSPWAMSLPGRPYAQFHVVLSGMAYVEYDNSRTRLEAGDIALFLDGSPHVISDGRTSAARSGRETVQSIKRGEHPFGTGEGSATLLSGHFEFDRAGGHPVFAGLPKLMHVAGVEHLNRQASDALLTLMETEAQNWQPGAEIVLERLAEIALVRTLRAYFLSGKAAPHFLTVVFSEQLAAVIALIHARYGETLTLQELAKIACMSRSAFVERFKEVTTMTPMAYLAQWRMLCAREMLAGTDRSVAEIAAAVGHVSQEGFSRAFKRQFGISPKAFRCVVSA